MKKINIKDRISKVKDNNKEKEKKKGWKRILSILLLIAIIGVSLLLAFALYIVITSPDFEEQELYQVEPTILYDIRGNEFARIGSEDSTIVTYEELPEILIDSLVATEDSRFFQHNGLDLFRFIKATAGQLLGSESAGGASTLSMQVIKNTYTQKGELEDNMIKSLIRKFKDIYMAVFKLEANYTKEEIIEFYLNSQWFSTSTNINVADITGVERASQHYFGKSVKDINLAEASLIAGMFQNPLRYNPYKNPEGCRNRQRIVLKLLVMHGYITKEQMDDVLSIPVEELVSDNSTKTTKVESNQAFIDYVIKEVQTKLKINPYSVSLEIYTTFDPEVQKTIEKVENGEIYTFLDEKVQEAIAITSTKDGSVTAMSGGRNYLAKGLNRATDTNRQPGSTAKPIFDYSMYIENISHSTYTMILDEPTTYSNGASVSNYDNKHLGEITMRYALKDSRNIPALKIFKQVYKLDPEIIENFVHSVGINYGDILVEAASIGGFNGVSPLELSAAYGTFGRGGYYIEPYGYTKVVNTSTGDEYTYSYTKTQVMEETTAYMINSILQDAYGGKGVSGTTIGGKTGTTNLSKKTKTDYGLPNGAVMDAWIVSYSPSYSIALWVGYDQLSSESAANKWYLTSGTGGTARRTIMNGLATNIHKKNESFKTPKGITTASVELQTYPAQLCSAYTPADMCVKELFVAGSEPTDVSPRYSQLTAPSNGSYTYSNNTITLKWDPIPTPKAIDTNYLSDFFNEYYDDSAAKYYNNRLSYNSSYIGTLVYDIYLKSNGKETYLGTTSSPTYSYYTSTSGNYEFVVKSAYSIFKYNASNGLLINAKADEETPIHEIIDDPVEENNEGGLN